MSRFTEYDNAGEHAALDQGRWRRNYRAALKGRRGRRALAELREALATLPERRLTASALCTVGGVDQRLPAMTSGDMTGCAAAPIQAGVPEEDALQHAEYRRRDREDARDKLARLVRGQGEGVCATGAFLWHRKVRDGMDPAEAFGSLPTVLGTEDAFDPLDETTHLGEDARLACDGAGGTLGGVRGVDRRRTRVMTALPPNPTIQGNESLGAVVGRATGARPKRGDWDHWPGETKVRGFPHLAKTGACACWWPGVSGGATADNRRSARV